jgi:rhodanese-related sulfurtransferase
MFRLFKPKGAAANLVSPAEAQALMERGEAILVDVREPDEWRADHIAGAVHVPLSCFESEASLIPTDRRVILYCRSGARSGRALDICRRLGLAIDTHISGGIMAWRSAGLA